MTGLCSIIAFSNFNLDNNNNKNCNENIQPINNNKFLMNVGRLFSCLLGLVTRIGWLVGWSIFASFNGNLMATVALVKVVNWWCFIEPMTGPERCGAMLVQGKLYSTGQDFVHFIAPLTFTLRFLFFFCSPTCLLACLQ